MKKLIILFLLIMSAQVQAGYDFSQTQLNNMKKAYNYGMQNKRMLPSSRMGDLNLGYVMAAILWQESSAGIECGRNGHAVGAFQNYIPTVKSRMKQNGVQKTTNQIQNELSQFNKSAQWATVELSYWDKIHKGNIQKTLASYNAGWSIGKGQGYSNSVMKKARYLKTNNVLKVE